MENVVEKPPKRKIRPLTIGHRLEIINQFEIANKKVKDIAKDFNIPQSTVSTILKNRDKWRQSKVDNENDLQRKRFKPPRDKKLESAVEIFDHPTQENNVTCQVILNMEKPPKRKIKTLTLGHRLAIIDQFEAGNKKVKDIARDFSIPQSTVSTILKNRDKWRQSKFDNENDLQKKRFRPPRDQKLERAMGIFVHQARENNLPVSGPIIRQKALEYAQQLNITEFKGSQGWLSKFLERHKISFKEKPGESVNTEFSGSWMVNWLPNLIYQYEARDIFNADETGLFYKCLPDKTHIFQNEPCHEGKYPKQRLTVLCATNMDGSEKLPLLVVGKSRSPHCLKDIKSLPVSYESNSKAWMTPILFEKWLLDLDQKFSLENRNVLMVVDKCTAHPTALQHRLQSINLQFFPPNSTSLIQPLDLGIIANLKRHYRRELVKQKLTDMENNQESVDVSLLEAINILSRAWAVKVKAETIQQCFRKGGFALADVNDTLQPEPTVKEEIPRDNEPCEDDIPGLMSPTSFDNYCEVDKNVICFELMTDADILENVTSEPEAVEDPLGGADLPVETEYAMEIKIADIKSNLEQMNSILYATENVPENIFKHFFALECFLTDRYALNRIQHM